jgi:hypothetical protein
MFLFQNKNTFNNGGYIMGEKCFYCTDDIEGNHMHRITFDVADSEREEILCRDCYQEWLQGIKG